MESDYINLQKEMIYMLENYGETMLLSREQEIVSPGGTDIEYETVAAQEIIACRYILQRRKEGAGYSIDERFYIGVVDLDPLMIDFGPLDEMRLTNIETNYTWKFKSARAYLPLDGQELFIVEAV